MHLMIYDIHIEIIGKNIKYHDIVNMGTQVTGVMSACVLCLDPILFSSGCCNKIPQTGVNYKQKFISHSSGAQKSMIKAPVWLVFGESLLPGSQLPFHYITWRKGPRGLLKAFYKALIPSMGAVPS